jgi:predicted ATPase/class 3 adenylate cyclase
VSFLYTDIEGSTRLWQAHPDVMPTVVSRHDRILRDAIEQHGGIIFRTVGDGCCAAFSQGHEAVGAALEAQRVIQGTPWENDIQLRVRMSLHSGPVAIQDGEYIGHTMNRVARLLSAAHGGQVLLTAAAQELVRDHLPPDVDLLDLGEHRLKDLQRPERVFELIAPDLPHDARGVVTDDAQRTNLPHDRTPFVGRRRDIEAVTEILERADVQLVTLTGPGGTGKTRLSLRVAGMLLDRFRDGVFFVPLAPVTDPSLVPGAIAAALGVEDVSGQSLTVTLQTHLLHKQILLVLDNFEHVIDAVPVVSDLLDSPGLTILVTSRSALRLSGEREYAVPPLAVPDPRHLPELTELSQYDAVALFIERARAVKAGFNVTNENAPAVAEICSRLDGLPLAIELAAARVRLFPPQALLARLQNRLSILTGGARDLPTRQQTLRGAIDWSYSLLDRGEQQLFARLSVFAGGFTLEAAEMVCNPEGDLEVDILDGVGSLVEKSLLRQVGEGEPRFVMLETIREYAAERLDELAGVADPTRQAHVHYFADLARRAWEQSSGGGQASVVAALGADLDNLRAAWRHGVREGDIEELNKLADSLWFLYDSRGSYRAEIDLMSELLDVLSSTVPSAEHAAQEITLRTARARALLAFQGYTQEVEDAYTGAIEAAGGEGALRQLFPVLRGLSTFYTYRGEFGRAEEVGRQILRLAEAHNDAGMRADGYLVLGESLAMQGQIHRGIEYLDTALQLLDKRSALSGRFRVGNNSTIAALSTSALALWLLGFPDQARDRLNRAVERAVRLEHPSTLAFALFHTGFLGMWRREPKRALECARQALEVAEEHNLQIWMAIGTVLRGAAESDLGDVENGLADIRAGLSFYQGLKSPPVFWPLLLYLWAGALRRAGQSGEGLRLIEDAIEIVGTQIALSPLFLVAKGDLLLDISPDAAAKAETWYRRALDRATESDMKMLQLRAAMGLVRAARSRDGAVEARQTLASVLSSFTEGFDTPDLSDARQLLDSVASE